MVSIIWVLRRKRIGHGAFAVLVSASLGLMADLNLAQLVAGGLGGGVSRCWNSDEKIAVLLLKNIKLSFGLVLSIKEFHFAEPLNV